MFIAIKFYFMKSCWWNVDVGLIVEAISFINEQIFLRFGAISYQFNSHLFTYLKKNNKKINFFQLNKQKITLKLPKT